MKVILTTQSPEGIRSLVVVERSTRMQVGSHRTSKRYDMKPTCVRCCQPYFDLFPLARLAATSRLTVGLLAHEPRASAYHIDFNKRAVAASIARMCDIVVSDA